MNTTSNTPTSDPNLAPSTVGCPGGNRGAASARRSPRLHWFAVAALGLVAVGCGAASATSPDPDDQSPPTGVDSTATPEDSTTDSPAPPPTTVEDPTTEPPAPPPTTVEDPSIVDPPPTTVVPATTSTRKPPERCSSYRSRSEIPVQRCDQGAPVDDVQVALWNWGFPIDRDGHFGPQTEDAVLAFQHAHGLVVDGIVGPETWQALQGYISVLGEPDGEPVGIALDDELQHVLYECVHHPYPGDAHVQLHQFLVEDPADGARTVVEAWAWDDVRMLRLSALSEATVGSAEISYDAPIFLVPVEFPWGAVDVTVNVEFPTRACNALEVTAPDDSTVSFGVADVCTDQGYTVLTLNSWEVGGNAPGFSELGYRASDDGADGPVADGYLRIGSEYRDVATMERMRSSKNEVISGTLTDGSTFRLAIDQYPAGGHECVWGQVID